MASAASEDDNSSTPAANVINGGALSSTASSSSSQQQQEKSQQQQQQNHGGGGAPAAPPPFLTKTYDMIEDSSTDEVVSWSSSGGSFVVWNPPEFARDLLPKYFKHNNFSSFVRQLNTYGFRKVDPDRWEFANEGFLRNHKHLLKGIHRRKPSAHAQGIESAAGHTTTSGSGKKVGLEAEVEKLNRDKNVLMLELVRLRQQQQQTERELHAMGQRLHGTEQRQQHMITFLAKAIRSPAFLSQVLQHDGVQRITGQKRKQLLDAKDAADAADDDDGGEELSRQIVRYDPSAAQAREKLIRFFSRSDLASKFEGPLQVELLVRELLLQHQMDEDTETNNNNNNNNTNNNTSNSLREDAVDSSSLEEDNRQLSPPSAVTEVSDVPVTPPLNLSLETPVAAQAPEVRLEGEVHASVDSGAVGVGFNDVFWERFLTDAEGNQTTTGPD